MFEHHFSSEPVKESDIAKIRAKFSTGFTQLAALIGAATKPLPNQTGNGTEVVVRDDSPDLLEKIGAGLKDLNHLGIRDVSTLIKVQQGAKSGAPIDDKDYMMEKLIQAAAKFPDDSKAGRDITNAFLKTLYNDLQHPPISYLGQEYIYRAADGSRNSLLNHDLGKSGTPYARTVSPRSMQMGALPSPEVIFDSVMVRKHHDKHPNKISSVLFYLAAVITHDLFRSSHVDPHVSLTSSYLDLSPLYGSNDPEQMKMRTFKDGKLKPDCFSEVRMVMFPAGAGTLLILFNRYHNYIADQLVAINQNGQFDMPALNKNLEPKKAEEKLKADIKKRENHIFQTARLITCGLYINIILTDYVRTILNLNKTNSNWALDPRADIKDVPVAAGNQVSAEFNLVYRWHSTISDRDEAWSREMWKSMFRNGEKPEEMYWHDFVKEANVLENALLAQNPEERDFHGWKRGSDGRFSDDDVAKEMSASIEDCANAYGANRVPSAMRVIQILGIMQARQWNLASLNEFRKHFNLKPHETFEDINSDPYVADQLKYLYDTPDAVELAVGLVVEEPKHPMVPGSGLTPSYTVSRAVLSDAVALVRGDRFYTVDYHPRKLTNWGFSEAATDKSITNGCVFHKLILRTLPNHFKANSVYAHYPLTIPSEMKSVLTALEKADRFDFGKPTKIEDPVVIFTYEACNKIINDQENFKVTWGEAIEFLMGAAAKDFMLAGDGPKNAESRKMMESALYIEGKWDKEVKDYYIMMTEKLLKKKAYKLANFNQVDVLRDVINLVSVHFAAEVFSLPLKTEERPLGIFSEHELYLVMAATFITIFFDLDPTQSFALRQKAHEATQILGKLVEANVTEIKASGLLNKLTHAIFPNETPLKDYGIHMIQRLLKSGMDVKTLVWGHIMGTAGGMTANQGQLWSQMFEFYLAPENKAHLAQIHELAGQDNDAAWNQLVRYYLEGCRINGETGVFRYAAKDITIKDGPKTYNLKQGDKIMVNLRAASKDPSAFPDPMKVKLDRPIESYIHLGQGPHKCLGWKMNMVAGTAMLKVIGKLKGLRPARGAQGKIAKVLRPFTGDADKVSDDWKFHAYLTEYHDMFFPFPQNLKINWD